MMRKTSFAAVVVAIAVLTLWYFGPDFGTRTPPVAGPTPNGVSDRTITPEVVSATPPGDAEVKTSAESATQTVTPNPTPDDRAEPGSEVTGAMVLRVVLEGISEEDAPRTRIKLTGVDHRRDDWPSHLKDTWSWRGSVNGRLTSEYALEPFFARVAGATNWDVQVDEFEVEACHSTHVIETARVPLSEGVENEQGQTIYEVRIRMTPGVPHVFWPELTLAVRDAHTRAHLDHVELRCVPNTMMGLGQVPGLDSTFTSFGGDLHSPIVLLGGRETDGPENSFTGIALGPAAGEAPQLLELVQSAETYRGVLVYARAPGYAWGTIELDVSTGTEHELLLDPGAALNVRMENVQLERYAALDTEATIGVDRIDSDGAERRAWIQRLDASLVRGLSLEGLLPGEYTIFVKLGEGWSKRPILARGEFSLAASETRELKVALANPPAPQELATLGGVVSFPSFAAEENVRLQLFYETSRRDPDVELSLADLEPVGGALPTWSFRLEDQPVGRYQVRLMPFMKCWMIDLPVDGREDAKFVLPEIAEVRVETVDARTGERIPFDAICYRYLEAVRGRVHNGLFPNWARTEFEEAGRFRFWTAPGAVSIWPYPNELGYGAGSKDLELVAGSQLVRFEFEPAYSISFAFRDGDAVLPAVDGIWTEVLVTKNIRAVDHEGRVTSIQYWSRDRRVEVSAPGIYEVSFEDVGADRFHAIPPQRVEVRAGESAKVTVELRRK